MRKIYYYNYDTSMGKLINVSHPLDYKENSIGDNIYYEKLLYNPSKYLDKNTTYYIMCYKGTLSHKVVANLEYNGYDVIQVVYK